MTGHDELTGDEREGLARGEHESVARGLLARGRPDLAAKIFEDIWDFPSAVRAHLQANSLVRALEAALAGEDPALSDEVIEVVIGEGDLALARTVAALLGTRGRHREAARVLQGAGGAAPETADALARSGDRLAAAEALADADRPHEALALLHEEPAEDPRVQATLARVRWSLGDAQGAARAAQAARRRGDETSETARFLAQSLVALGHDLAASLIVPQEELADAPALPGRYLIRGPIPANIAGSAYDAVDRVTMREVEVHLLLSDLAGDPANPAVLSAIKGFADQARAAAGLGHPAIRPILSLDPGAGLLIMPRAEGTNLRRLVRDPPMAPVRGRSMIAFLAEGLAAASAAGLAHGAILPSLLDLDGAGRPCLGPFGTDHLRGLMATRTGTLEEILWGTAPELREQEHRATATGDLYSLGALWAALVVGRLGVSEGELAALPAGDGKLIRQMMADDPAARPSLQEVLAHARTPVPDVADLGVAARLGPSASGSHKMVSAALETVSVVAHESWSDEALDALAAGSDPWLQPILDRDGRRFELALWPPQCRRLPAQTAEWTHLMPAQAAATLPGEARRAVMERLAPESLVATARGAFMLALDDLLSR